MFTLTRLAAVAMLLIVAGGCQGVAPAAPPAIAKGDYPAVVAYLKQRIAYDMDAQRVPGLSIAIVDDQRTVWSGGFGYADAARHRNATGDTLYRVGAISKIVTAAGVLRAADDGRLSLDVPAAQALPHWEAEPRRVAMHWMGTYPFTARRLLALRPDTLEDTMGRARADMGYALLGDMVAHVADEPFDAYVRRTLLRPLNISRAGFRLAVEGDEVRELRAAGYRRGMPWIEQPQSNEAAEGLWASSAEMARFSSMLFAGGTYQGRRILKDESALALLNLETVASGMELECRLALSWLAAPCDRDYIAGDALRQHSGATEAFHARWVLAPREKLAVLVMSNADSAEPLVTSVSSLAMNLMRQAKGVAQE
ncbi:serine hydrolase domain-containing protein [Achromobacter xylosoxidans]|uniref:serine hydrolase domain-containing protein n=2 Tax=Alcaligenes xylosoxydans xylosoxydans TaxID=85698 RepID=UPI0006C358F2|nr:serine hydrolase domain-containing protein [Achromobacter xylosoxidans]AUZ20165.1 serine hydrolase [Achromobacter xylosoxidans]MCH4573879.1 beta-lactamase family protein [Achromobacter xylosoxidans]MDD7987925.1 serine hydrolase [Achromobacter xylosoxidans]OFO68151.1 serine hydrolase [Achromobacter xylosoxidans]OMG82366.1 serine hydrolase [Achromobacter xylosoxidans]